MTMFRTYDTVSVHQHLIEDDDGDVVDVVELCTDWCHREWCAQHGAEYDGWNGCHEVQVEHGTPMLCAHCGSDMAIV